MFCLMGVRSTLFSSVPVRLRLSPPFLFSITFAALDNSRIHNLSPAQRTEDEAGRAQLALELETSRETEELAAELLQRRRSAAICFSLGCGRFVAGLVAPV